MTLARANSLNWGVSQKLTSAQINTIDSQLPYAVDGHAGGSYAPSSAITIAGSGLTVAGPLVSAGTATFSTPATFNNVATFNGTSFHSNGASHTFLLGSTLNVAGDTNISGSLFFTGAVALFSPATTVSVGGFLSVDGYLGGNTALSGAKTVPNGAILTFESGAACTLAGGSTCTHQSGSVENYDSGSNATYASGATVTFASGASLNLSGTTLATTAIKCQGAGRVVKRRILGIDGDTTYSIADADVIQIPNLTGARTYKFSTVGAQDGDTIMLTMASLGHTVSANAVNVQRVDSTTIGPTLVKQAAGVVWQEIIFDGTRWESLSYGFYDN